MHTRKRLGALVALLMTSSLLMACTPEQVATYQNLTGVVLPQEHVGVLRALPDTPWRQPDGSTIEIDGSLTPAPARSSCATLKDRINSATYNYDDSGPAMVAAEAVAQCRGWSDAQFNSWKIALRDVMRFESGFCYNIINGASLASGAGCQLRRQGGHGAAGFGQLVSIHYQLGAGEHGWLCREESLCSKWDIVATPWNSMTALLALIERSGTSGWCYSASARRLHHATCGNPGMDV